MRRCLFNFLGIFSLTILTLIPASAQAIPGIGPDGTVTRAQTGFTFTEGPAADTQGNIYFTDVQRSRIHVLDTQGQLSTFLENTQGANGLMFDGRGRLIACQGGAGRIIAIDIATKAIEVVADQFQGKRFNSPNDLVVDRQGGVYFSDPVFGGTQVQDVQAVYYVNSDKQVTRLIGDLTRPNGVILSPDEATLYVLHGLPNVMAYPVTAPGQLGPGRVLTDLQSTSGGDGMTVDSQGNLYLTRPGINAVQVVTPAGQSLGLIQVSEAPSNCTFGGTDLKTLLITARTSVYTAKMLVTGHRFGGPATGGNDTQKPVVTTLAVSKSKVVRKKDPTLAIGWASSDNVGVVGHDILYATDGTTFSTTVATGLPGDMTNFTWTIPASLAKTKTGVVKVVAKDAAGNAGEAVSAKFTIK
ncbi:MAG: SMP-30/gluconolactonase/LRE family protein [Blastocatellia bacterium]|nr:SMP-30/gluconolactonase/LRE family protein [Blastocatellia bacterium]